MVTLPQKKYNRRRLLQKIAKVTLAKETIDSSPLEILYLDDLSRKVGMNKKDLMHYFQEMFNTGVYEYQKAKKLAYAQDLLIATDKSIKEIALIVGYKRHATFTRAFTAEYNISPTDFRDGNWQLPAAEEEAAVRSKDISAK